MQVSATAARTILSLAPLPDRPTRSAQTILSLAALRDKTILRVLIPSLVTTPAWLIPPEPAIHSLATVPDATPQRAMIIRFTASMPATPILPPRTIISL